MSGLHDICHMNARTQADEYTVALRRARIDAGVDAEIGVQVRLLLEPGVKRKTMRLDELREMVADTQARWARQVTR